MLRLFGPEIVLESESQHRLPVPRQGPVYQRTSAEVFGMHYSYRSGIEVQGGVYELHDLSLPNTIGTSQNRWLVHAKVEGVRGIAEQADNLDPTDAARSHV